ncbi:MAG: histidinol-phosphate aminotransferase family protein [Eubacteriaceae bacterium]|jgi:histidinol-phosphate aminotransferase|nr:histidinol-phosphate aminotransferase family protein [Eubacteriaceae bacterium]
MNKLIREEYRGAKPPVNEAAGFETLLYCNENPANLADEFFGKEAISRIASLSFNRYPDCEAKELRSAYAEFLGCGAALENIAAGNGSDELLRSIGDVFLEAGETLMSCEPAFSVYKRAASLAKGQYFEVVSERPDHRPEVSQVIREAKRRKAKVIAICTPHNPLGYAWPAEDLLRLRNETEGLLVVDEAYIEFSEKGSFFPYALSDSRVIVLRTMSKLFSLAALRIGFAIGSKENITALLCAVDMYNVNSFSQAFGVEMLKKKKEIGVRLEALKASRDQMYDSLRSLGVAKVFPSEGNFFYLETPNAAKLAMTAASAGILVRTYGDGLHLRVTVGSPEENERLLKAFQEAG